MRHDPEKQEKIFRQIFWTGIAMAGIGLLWASFLKLWLYWDYGVPW
jgi:hypothetical protein